MKVMELSREKKRERRERGHQLFREKGELIRKTDAGLYRVPGSRGDDHYVDARRKVCSCWDWQRINAEWDEELDGRPTYCKHVVAVMDLTHSTASAFFGGCCTESDEGEEVRA